MADAPFKEMIDRDAVLQLARGLAPVAREFDTEAFVADATHELDALELKDRVAHVADALRAHLPSDVEEALDAIVASLPPGLEGTDGTTSTFGLWPLCTFVERHALDVPEAALDALRELTQRFSGEFAVRPFIERWPKATFARLERWTHDPNPHVRRLVSEGTRPRLPWASRLRALDRDPTPAIALLERLRHDPEPYVQRSVGNHLNDISKRHPERVVALCRRWLDEPAPAHARVAWIVERALRTLVKRGDTDALAVLGFRPPQVRVDGPHLSTTRLQMPDTLTIDVEVTSTADETQQLLLDFVVYHRKADDSLSPRVFKWTRFELGPGATHRLRKRHRIRPVTTRRYHAGEHRVTVQINGAPVGGTAAFDLALPVGRTEG